MKRQKKWATITGLAVVAVIALAAILFAFVPIKGKNGTYTSFFGAQKYSSDVTEKMVVTYTYNEDIATIADAKAACKKIQNCVAERGYVSCTASPVGANKIELSVAKPQTGADLQELITLVGASGIGVGSFEIKTSSTATDESIIIGSKHVKSIAISQTYGYYYTVVVKFNDKGKALLQAAEAAATEEGKTLSYYMFFGSSVANSDALTSDNFVNGDLYAGSFTNDTAAKQYKFIMEMGCLPVALESITLSDITFENSTSLTTKLNSTQIALWVFVLCVLAAYLILIALRHGAYAYISAFLSNAIVIPLALLLFSAMDFVELYSSSIIVFGLMTALFNTFILQMFEKMRAQKKLGKDIEMCIDSGFIKILMTVISVSCLLSLAGLICAVSFGGAIQSAGAIICVFAVLSALASLLLTKWLFVALLKLFPTTKSTLVWGDENNAK